MGLDATATASAGAVPTGPALGGPRLESGLPTRLMSLIGLAGIVSGLAYGAAGVYRAFSDAFVAPIILSPDNDLVIQSKLGLARLVAERQAIRARLDANEAAGEATRQGIAHLERLRSEATRALDWSRTVTEAEAATGAGVLAGLADQAAEVKEMVVKQEAYVAELRKHVAAGLMRKADLVREENVLGQLRVVALQNDRERMGAELHLWTTALAQNALKRGQRLGLLLPPEMQSQRAQVVRIELELLKLNSDLREKLSQVQPDEDALARADELIAQMKGRPIYRAIEASQNVAFVPYTQLAGVRAGFDVYRCDLFGVFGCRRVGHVTEVLPGEVAAQDPWGTPARGQYAVLSLEEAGAAQARTLRVRQGAEPTPGAARTAATPRPATVATSRATPALPSGPVLGLPPLSER